MRDFLLWLNDRDIMNLWGLHLRRSYPCKKVSTNIDNIITLQPQGQQGGMGNPSTMPLPRLISAIRKPVRNVGILQSGKPLGMSSIPLTAQRASLSSQPLDVWTWLPF